MFLIYPVKGFNQIIYALVGSDPSKIEQYMFILRDIQSYSCIHTADIIFVALNIIAVRNYSYQVRGNAIMLYYFIQSRRSMHNKSVTQTRKKRNNDKFKFDEFAVMDYEIMYSPDNPDAQQFNNEYVCYKYN